MFRLLKNILTDARYRLVVKYFLEKLIFFILHIDLVLGLVRSKINPEDLETRGWQWLRN